MSKLNHLIVILILMIPFIIIGLIDLKEKEKENIKNKNYLKIIIGSFVLSSSIFILTWLFSGLYLPKVEKVQENYSHSNIEKLYQLKEDYYMFANNTNNGNYRFYCVTINEKDELKDYYLIEGSTLTYKFKFDETIEEPFIEEKVYKKTLNKFLQFMLLQESVESKEYFIYINKDNILYQNYQKFIQESGVK